MNKIDSFYLTPAAKEEAERYRSDIRSYLTYYSSNYKDKAIKTVIMRLWPQMITLFPLRKASATVYRGLSYPKTSIEAYVSLLIKLLSKGSITSNEFRSWTLDKATAEEFAYFDPHTIQGNNTAHYVGGCILKTSIQGKYAVDIDYADASDYDESEVLLPPGTYQCTLLNAVVFSVKDSAVDKPLKKISFEDMHVLSYNHTIMAKHCAIKGIFVEELNKSEFLKALLALQRNYKKLNFLTKAYNQYAFNYL